MDLRLNAAERRVLGALMEKEMTTPDYYPMTVNALVAACNQKSNREPVMELEEAAVRGALNSLYDKGLAREARGEGRVARFEHNLGQKLNLGRRESALLCTLLLRGAQTPGELRGRSERMHRIEDLDELQLVLQKLMGNQPPLAILLPRQPGTKESRYADCLGGDEAALAASSAAPSAASYAEQASAASSAGDVEHSAALEAELAGLKDEVTRLRNDVSELRQQLAALRAQLGG